jgi:DNA-directed RNA polymerase specialized sigma24 family protein
MAHIKSRTRGFINISAVNAAEYLTIEQTLFFNNLRKDESIIKLALKMAIRGMSTEGIADVLEVQPVTVSNCLSRAAKQCEKIKLRTATLP